ncbi:MAG TPA: hypothetical protein VN729_13050, partial [Ktedonobacteraceae bacterium]|nr:hypothetical protein [Ktedonobacteraceae bacterium]
GATLQTLLTGKEPWEIQATGIPADCDIPDELQTLIAQMLAPEPERRPASMKQVGESLRKLRQNDPLSYPFSLLIIVWLCLMMAVRSFLFDHLTFLFALLAFPLTLLGMACLTAIIMGYYFYKAKLAKAGRLIGKDLRLIAEKSMGKSLLFISITSFWGTVTSISGKLLDVKVLIYLAIFLAGLVLLPKFWPPFLEKIKQKLAAQHNQLVAQAPPMEQKIHRRQF